VWQKGHRTWSVSITTARTKILIYFDDWYYSDLKDPNGYTPNMSQSESFQIHSPKVYLFNRSQCPRNHCKFVFRPVGEPASLRTIKVYFATFCLVHQLFARFVNWRSVRELEKYSRTSLFGELDTFLVSYFTIWALHVVPKSTYHSQGAWLKIEFSLHKRAL
jgi:hypothetical protein